MKKIILFLVISMFTISCSTIFNKKNYNLKIQSNEKDAKVKILDSIYDLPTTVKVKRSKENLNLQLITDSLQKSYELEPRLTNNFKYGNLAFIYFAPAAYAVDLTTHKRYYYGKNVTLNNDSIAITYQKNLIWRKYPKNKGEIYFNASIPYINIFQLQPENMNVKSNTGFFGISVGADYFYSKNKFANFTLSHNMDFVAPVPAPVSYDDGLHETFSSSSFMLTNNHQFNRFSLGYGITYAINVWKQHDDTLIDNNSTYVKQDDIKKQYSAFGLAFPAYFQFGRFFYAGVIYRPTFYRPTLANKFTYEHVISIDFKFKFRIKE